MRIFLQFLIFTLIFFKAEAAKVRISDLSDLSYGTWSVDSGSDIDMEDDLCVYSDVGTYYLNATGGPNDTNFRIYHSNYVNSSPNNDRINYNLYWYDAAGGGGTQTQLTSNTQEGPFVTSETKNQNCKGGNNLSARIRLNFTFNQLRKALAGDYSGILTLTIIAP